MLHSHVLIFIEELLMVHEPSVNAALIVALLVKLYRWDRIVDKTMFLGFFLIDVWCSPYLAWTRAVSLHSSLHSINADEGKS